MADTKERWTRDAALQLCVATVRAGNNPKPQAAWDCAAKLVEFYEHALMMKEE